MLIVVVDIFFGLLVEIGVTLGVVINVDYIIIFIVLKLGLFIGKVWDVIG